MESYNQLKQQNPELYDQLLNWVRHGTCPSAFLKYALCNDLAEVVLYADEDQLAALKPLVQTLYNYIPSHAWRAANVKNWADAREAEPWTTFDFSDRI